MVMSTGTIRPSLACAWVAALNSLQKPMMFTPCWPSAGPTGGEGFALSAGSWSLTIPVIFLAMTCVFLSDCVVLMTFDLVFYRAFGLRLSAFGQKRPIPAERRK